MDRLLTCAGRDLYWALLAGAHALKPLIPLLSLAAFCLVTAGEAQDRGSPVSDALRLRVQRAGRNLVAAAEQMPADKYGFKPTRPQMTFGEVIAHVATGGDALCSSIAGVPTPKRAATATSDSKEKLVGRLRETFGFCESALANLNDLRLDEKVPYFSAGEVSRADAMFAAAEELAGHYSQLAVYFRLNGLVPPTAKGGGSQ
jgi:uncharacterized damage-inducible protein DinB